MHIFKNLLRKTNMFVWFLGTGSCCDDECWWLQWPFVHVRSGIFLSSYSFVIFIDVHVAKYSGYQISMTTLRSGTCIIYIHCCDPHERIQYILNIFYWIVLHGLNSLRKFYYSVNSFEDIFDRVNSRVFNPKQTLKNVFRFFFILFFYIFYYYILNTLNFWKKFYKKKILSKKRKFNETFHSNCYADNIISSGNLAWNKKKYKGVF